MSYSLLVQKDSPTFYSSLLPTRVNRATNPSFESGSVGWVAQWFGSGAGAGTFSFQIDGGFIGSNYVRKLWSASPTSADDTGIAYGSSASSILTVTSGETVTFSMYMRSSKAQTVIPYMAYYTSGGVLVSTDPAAVPVGATAFTLGAGQWTRVWMTSTVPATAARAVFICGPYQNGAVNWSVGDTLDADALLIESGNKLLPYFDGDTKPLGWLKTANISATRYTDGVSQERFNLFPDPQFAVGNVSRGGIDSVNLTDTSWFKFGGTSAKITVGSPAPSAAYWLSFQATPNGYVTAGSSYVVSTWVYSSSSFTSTLSMNWNNASGGYITTSYAPALTTVPARTPTFIWFTTIAPAGTFSAAPSVFDWNATLTTGQSFNTDAVMIEPGTVPNTYVDGSLPQPANAFTTSWTGVSGSSTSILAPAGYVNNSNVVPTFLNASYTQTPLVANSSYALVVAPSAASVQVYHAGDALYKNFENKTVDLEFWFSFNSLFDGAGYLKNTTASSRYFINNLLKIVDIVTNTGTEIGYVAYDYNKNTFRFSIPGVGNTDAYVPVRHLDTSFYVNAIYKDKQLSIVVNGDSGVNGSVSTTTNLPTKTSGSVFFNINGNSINNASTSFIISDFATYDYELTNTQHRDRIVWASNYGKPVLNTGPLGLSYFDLSENYGNLLHYDNIEGPAFKERVSEWNVSYDNVLGLTFTPINKLSFSPLSASNASVSYSSSGASFANYAMLENVDFGNIVAGGNVITLTSQFTFGSASSDYLFAFNDVNAANLYYLQAASNRFVFGSYNYSSSVSSSIAAIPTTLTSGSSYNFGINVTSGNVTMFGNGASATASTTPISVALGNSLYIGNAPTISSATSRSTLKNVGINTLPIKSFPSIDFTRNYQYMARLTTDNSVSQVGQWVRKIPLSMFDMNIVGSKVVWDSMDNVLVESSTDSGFTWTTLTRNSPIPGLVPNALNQDVDIRVTVPYEYAYESENQSFSGLEISLYQDLRVLSSDSKYLISPKADSSSANPYVLQKVTQPINLRRDLFGIGFGKSSTAFAQITPTASAAPLGIEFWVRLNAISGASQYLLTGSAVGSPIDIQLTSTGYLATNSTSATLYVNGLPVSSSSFKPSVGEFYHLMLNFGQAYSGSSININGIGAGSHAYANYGFLNLWPSAIDSYVAADRYLNYTGTNIVQIIDTASPLWKPIFTLDAKTTASGYKIG